MIQLAQSTVLLCLLSLVTTQQLFPTYNNQRMIWQQQIDKVRQAEEQLRLQSLPTVRTYEKVNAEQSREIMDKEERVITTLSAGPELQKKLFEPSSTVPRTK